MKPLLFIGSSSESLDIAFAVQENLEDVAQVIVWTQGIFGLSQFMLESLLDVLDESEFGAFVFAPEDITKIRGTELKTTRDNVIFELGLFIGRLGRERCFIVMPRGVADFHLPTDLLGITPATFEPPSEPKWLQASLGAACHKIRKEIQTRGSLRPTPPEPVAPMDEPHVIESILPFFLSEYERTHVVNLVKGNTKGYQGRGSLRAELRHLRSMGLVQNRPGRAIGDMKTGMQLNLADYVELTDLGKQWGARMK